MMMIMVIIMMMMMIVIVIVIEIDEHLDLLQHTMYLERHAML